MRLASGQWTRDDADDASKYHNMRLDLIAEDVRDMVLAIARDSGADLSTRPDDGTPEAAAALTVRACQYAIAAALLLKLVATSEEVRDFVMPQFVSLEARAQAHGDNHNRRN